MRAGAPRTLRTSASVMLMRRRSQPGQSAGAGAAAGVRPSNTSTRFWRTSTRLSSAFSRVSVSCAPAGLHASARSARINAAARALERIAQPRRDSLRIAAAGRCRSADAVLAEVAQAATLVVHLDVFGDEVEVAIEEVFVRERDAGALRLLRAGGTAVLGLAQGSDALVHAEGAREIQHAGLLLVGIGAVVLPVLRADLHPAHRVLAGDAVAGFIGSLGRRHVGDGVLVLLIAVGSVERSAGPLERAAVKARIRARRRARHRGGVALALVARRGDAHHEAAEVRRPVLQDVVGTIVERELAHGDAGGRSDRQVAERIHGEQLADLEGRVPAAHEDVAEVAHQSHAAVARGEAVRAAGRVVGLEAGLELAPALEAAHELLLGLHAEKR